MPDTTSPYTIEDDEIDFFRYISAIWRQRKLCIAGVITGVILAIIITLMSPKEYRAQVTFLLPSGGSSVSMNVGLLESYLGLNASGGGSQFGKYIEALLSSSRLKVMVAKEFQKPNEKIEETLGRLQINSRNLEVNEEMGLFTLSFSNQKQKLVFPVINSLLKNLEELSHIMELDVNKQLITILDRPTEPKFPYKPNLKMNLIFGVIGGLALCIFMILCLEIRKEILERFNQKDAV